MVGTEREHYADSIRPLAGHLQEQVPFKQHIIKIQMRNEEPVKPLPESGLNQTMIVSKLFSWLGANGLVERLKSFWNQNWQLVSVLVGATFIAYLPALDGQFVWDDQDYVANN